MNIVSNAVCICMDIVEMAINQNAIIENSLILAKNYLDAQGAMFYWINEDKRDAFIDLNINVSKEFIYKYHNLLQDYDPLNVAYFLKSHENINLLSTCNSENQKVSVYKRFANDCGIDEILEIVFWRNNHAYAGIAVTNPNDYKKRDESSIQVLHQILGTSIFELGNIKDNIVKNYLKDLKLTTREMEVCNFITKGYANQDIAEAMEISLGTVKINANRIFDKLQVDGRLQLSILLSKVIK